MIQTLEMFLHVFIWQGSVLCQILTLEWIENYWTPDPSASQNAELDRSQLLSGAHTINDHISTSPGQSQLQICLLNPNNILVNPKQRISVSLILRVCSK